MNCKGPAQPRGTPKRARVPPALDSQSSTAKKKARAAGRKQYNPRQVLARVIETKAKHAAGQPPDRRSELVLDRGREKIR